MRTKLVKIFLLFGLLLPIVKPQADTTRTIIIKPDLYSQPADFRNSDLPGIGLAISGGGARGLAVIGVLKVLERENIKIDFIAGVSMGGIIGGLYSCGYSAAEIEKIAYDVNWGDILSPSPSRSTLLITQKGQAEKSLFKLRFQGWKPVMPRAITSAQKLSQLLERLTARGGIRSSISFDNLDPAIRIICTDLLTGERVVLSKGNISEAMRASMAIPVAFTPVEIDGRLLVDGGLVDPIPVDIVRSESNCPVVAIDVSSGLLPLSSINNVVDIADQTTTIMGMDRKRNSKSQADLCITPELNNRANGDFSHIDSLIKAGEAAAEKALPAILGLLLKSEMKNSGGTVYPVNNVEICDLTSLPNTLFASSFNNSDSISTHSVEENLARAYFSGYLRRAWAELKPDTSGFCLSYHLIDNARISVINFSGATLFKANDLYGIVKTKPGMILNYRTLESDRKALEDHYINYGYSLIRVATSLDSSANNLTFIIDEGRINGIRIEGARKTKNWVITRHIPFRTGDIYQQGKADRAIDDIFSTGLFETAKLLASPDSAGVTLVVKVIEKPYNFVRGGARFDLDYGSKAFFDLVMGNLFGSGQEAYISTTIGEKKRSVALNLHTDRIFKSLFASSMSLDYGELKRSHYKNHKYQGYYKLNSYGAELTPGRQIPQFGIIYIVGQLRRYQYFEPGSSKRQQFDKVSIGLRSIVDTRNVISFPDRGKYHTVDIQFASDIHNEKRAYTRFLTSLEGYYPITKRFNIHPRFAMGASSDFMPYFDEFQIGGLNSLLGLHESENLGDKLLSGSLELRQKIGDRTYILARYDMGNVWNKLERVKLSTLIYGGGIGLAVKTPIGPIQAWYGRTSKGFDAFYLDIGYDW
jgi:NTE family protein